MTDYEYDEKLPYVVTDAEGEVLARFRYREVAEYCMGESFVIDTTPKPRVPEDAQFITWLINGRARWFAERRNGDWAVDGATYDRLVFDRVDGLPGVTPDTVFTVLDERKNDD